MAHLYHPTYTRTIPKAADIVTIKRVRHARWTGRKGRKFLAPLCEDDPTRCLAEVDCWWCEYEDHTGERCREKCYRDRLASETKMLEIRQRIDRIASGDLSPASQSRGKKDMGKLVAEWRADMESRDTSPKQIRLSVARVESVVADSGAGRPADLTASLVGRVLKRFRGRAARPISAKTSNHYQSAVHHFLHWCVAQGYVDADPLAGARPVEMKSRQTFERRAITVEELGRLLAATRANNRPRCPLDARSRAMLYLTAVYTGLRLAELASLTRASFRLDPDAPQIDIHGRASKNKKSNHQPIPEAVAVQLREWLTTRPASGPVWVARRWRKGGAAAMLRGDLEAAGIEPETDAGRLDFHALRTSFGTMLAIAGVPIQHAQRLMRHSSPVITSRHYTKLLAGDLAGQIGKLPTPPA